VELFFLGFDLLLEEVDVVDEQDIDIAVLVLEGLGRLVPYRLYEFVVKFPAVT
jgi:hypothetical protein